MLKELHNDEFEYGVYLSMKGKLIVIEGTDCSGKETQCKKLIERLTAENIKVFEMPFPRYDTPTGKIIGGPLLGKPAIAKSYFDNPGEVDARVVSLYYAADRLYNIAPIIENLNNGVTVILDRYTTSNMAFQGGKIKDYAKRQGMYEYISTLEYDLLGLPRPDNVIFLHMPYEAACILKAKRAESLDDVEKNEAYLRQAENTYLELSNLNNWTTITCAKGENIRSIEDINNELYRIVKEIIINE